MKTAEVIELQGSQAVKLPDDFRFDGESVWISRQGDAVILQPMKWPSGPRRSSKISGLTIPRSAGPTKGRCLRPPC